MATGLETGRPSNRGQDTVGRNVRFWTWFFNSPPSPILEAQVSIEIRAGAQVAVRSDPKSQVKAVAKVSSEPLRLSFGPAAKRYLQSAHRSSNRFG